MAAEPEEITMVHYEMSRALADEHIRDLLAAAKRHELVAAARCGCADASESSSRRTDVTSRMVAKLSGLRRPAAGPMGCSA